MKILVIDVGGTNIKLQVGGAGEIRKIPSGTELSGQLMVDVVKQTAADWK